MNEEIINAKAKLIDNEEIIKAMEIIDEEIIAESNIESDVKAMNKIMFFMVNCGYHDVHKLVYSVFDSNLANHIFKIYESELDNTRLAFFNIYFHVDSDCKKKICAYISQNYNDEQKLYK